MDDRKQLILTLIILLSGSLLLLEVFTRLVRLTWLG